MRGRAALELASAGPGPSGSGTSSAAGLAEDRGQGVGPAAAAPATPGRPRARRAPRPGAAAASRRPAPRHRQVGLGGRRLAHQQRRQLVAAPAAQVLDLGLRLGVALDRVGRELVDVGEDRLGEQGQHLGLEAGLRPAGRRDPPPGDPGADPVGGLQRVEAAALAQLAAAERDVDLAARPAAGVGVADQGDELAQRLGDAGADAAAEAALQRARVLGHLAGDRRRGSRR